MNILREALHVQVSGAWEPLATAAGASSAVQATELGLSATELARGALGLAQGPSVIRERVEALAAYDPARLARLAQAWIAPDLIQGYWWWTSAWHASLRHLKGLGVIDRGGVSVPELREEAAILWPVSPDERLTLPEAFRHAELEGHPYAYARTLDGKIDRTPLRANYVPSELPVHMLRLLRGKASWLSEADQHLLIQAARRSLLHPDESVFRSALLAELVREIDPTSLDEMETQLLARLPGEFREERIRNVAYTLLGSWAVP